MIKIITTLLFFFAISLKAGATPIADYQFKSPSFTGNDYSAHALTIENQEFTRQAQIKKDIQAALDKAKADAQRTLLE